MKRKKDKIEDDIGRKVRQKRLLRFRFGRWDLFKFCVTVIIPSYKSVAYLLF